MCFRAVMPLVLVCFAACDAPTGPARAAAPPPLAAGPAVSAALAAAIEDVRERILPQLPEAAEPGALSAALDDVAAALSARDVGAISRAVSTADVALTRLEDDEVLAACAPDLQAVRLVLYQVRALLPQPTDALSFQGRSAN